MLRRLRTCLVFAPIVAAAGCATATDPSTGFDREVRGGRLHAAPVADFHRPDQLDLGAALASPELRVATGGVEAAQLRERGRTISLDGSGVALVHVALQQQVDGVPIHGAYLAITARPAATGAPARLAASAYHLFPGAHAEVVPALDAAAAHARARAAARVAATAPVRTSELVLWPLDGRLYLVWEITIVGVDRRILVHAGARARASTRSSTIASTPRPARSPAGSPRAAPPAARAPRGRSRCPTSRSRPAPRPRTRRARVRSRWPRPAPP